MAESTITVRRALESFTDWFEDTLVPAAERQYLAQVETWRGELEAIREGFERATTQRVALVGSTGAGKSTFLNAVVEQEILPVGVMQPCTAFVTSVSHWSEPGYRVAVEFATRDEWEAERQALISMLSAGESDSTESEIGESKRLMNAALKRLQAVYGQDYDPVLMPLPDDSPELRHIFSRRGAQSKRFSTSSEMLTYLKGLIRGDAASWPLVKQVSIQGPYSVLDGGVELVDLPGLNDPNEARVEVTREFLRTSPNVWLLFSMVRGLTEDIRRILEEERLLRTMVFSGNYTGLALVGTKADDVDVNIADQLDLPDDCSQPDLIRVYGEKTSSAAREQLVQMVKDLASAGDHGETLQRMLHVAANVRVHTTSSSAFNKLAGVGRLRRDYGLSDKADTGIPGVRQHLAEIARRAGPEHRATVAAERLDHLRNEIAFFFQAQTQRLDPSVERTRQRLAQERESFSADLRRAQVAADSRIRARKDQFLDTLHPMCEASISGVHRTTDAWGMTHWATLRAIVQRDGTFKSPSSGRLHDLNEDIAEPLLRHLPLSWEQFFTDDLNKVASEFEIRVTESVSNFCGRLALIVEMQFGRKNTAFDQQLAWFRDKVNHLVQASQGRVLGVVRERRGELAAKMPNVAKTHMLPAYSASKAERGTGLKQRILARLRPTALEAARPIFSTIEADLLQGVTNLEVLVSGMFRALVAAAEEQAGIVAHNANLDVQTGPSNERSVELLRTLPPLLGAVSSGTASSGSIAATS